MQSCLLERKIATDIKPDAQNQDSQLFYWPTDGLLDLISVIVCHIRCAKKLLKSHSSTPQLPVELLQSNQHPPAPFPHSQTPPDAQAAP